MSEVTIYTTEFCAFCNRAKALFDKKSVPYREVDVSYDAAERARLVERSGGMRTVPQIFIGEKHIGGCDDLYALNAKGGLDPLLGAT